MLKNISPLLTADALHARASAGYGDKVATVAVNSFAASLKHFDFYRRAHSVFPILQTSYQRKYGNILLRKGVRQL